MIPLEQQIAALRRKGIRLTARAKPALDKAQARWRKAGDPPVTVWINEKVEYVAQRAKVMEP